MNTELLDINSMRTMLSEEIGKLRNGDTTAANINAIVNATGKILTTVKMEMEYGKLLGITPKIDFIKVEKVDYPRKEALVLKKRAAVP